MHLQFVYAYIFSWWLSDFISLWWVFVFIHCFRLAMIPLCLWCRDSLCALDFITMLNNTAAPQLSLVSYPLKLCVPCIYAYIISRCPCHYNASPFIDAIKLLDGKIRIFAIKVRIFYCVFYVTSVNLFSFLSRTLSLWKRTPQMWQS